MNKSLGTPTNTKIFTVSAWVKAMSDASLDTSVAAGYVGTSDRWNFQFGAGKIQLTGSDIELATNKLFRDSAAWWHIVVAVDTSQGTDSNRVKLYINGAQETSLSSSTYPTQDMVPPFCDSNGTIYVGEGTNASGVLSKPFDGYIAEFCFVDGQQLAPTSFGEFDSDSPTIWKPIDPSGLTFGNNGFYLDFEASGNLGNDVNGGTDLSEVNIVAADQCVDSPTNNFATLNPLHMSDPSANYFVDNGNNTLEATNNDVDRLTGATIHPMGIKGYFEYKILTDNNCRVALQEDGVALTKSNYTALASGQFYGLYGDDITYANGGSSANHIVDYIDSSANGDIIGCAFDFTGSNRNVWWHLNGTYGNNGSGVGVPATGAYPGITSTQLSASKNFEFVFMCNTGSSSSSIALNFGNGSFDGTAISSAGTNASFGTFEYDVPSGFGPICTKTLNGTYS